MAPSVTNIGRADAQRFVLRSLFYISFFISPAILMKNDYAKTPVRYCDRALRGRVAVKGDIHIKNIRPRCRGSKWDIRPA